jgi:hypothetical protein
MTKPRREELWQAAICLLCLILLSREIKYLGPSEFSGGYITGRLFWLADKAWVLFGVGLLLTFVFRRAAAGFLLVASLLCWPLYLYLTFPAVVRKAIGGEYKVPLTMDVIWDKWAITGMLTLVLAAYISIRSLSVTTKANPR